LVCACAAGHVAPSAAGIHILQLLEDAGVVVLCVAANMSATARSAVAVGPDRTQLVVDLGASLLAISLLAMHQGLFHHLMLPAYHPNIGGDAINN